MCCRCGDEGYFVLGCKNLRCYNCEFFGYRVVDCDKDLLCGICLDLKYFVVNCFFFVFSVNVCNVEEDVNYVDVVRVDFVVRVWRNIFKELVLSEVFCLFVDKNVRLECVGG